MVLSCKIFARCKSSPQNTIVSPLIVTLRKLSLETHLILEWTNISKFFLTLRFSLNPQQIPVHVQHRCIEREPSSLKQKKTGIVSKLGVQQLYSKAIQCHYLRSQQKINGPFSSVTQTYYRYFFPILVHRVISEITE